ncbi:MAG: hypothetical protein AAGN82_22705, partial [Myxococcota bacterium]
MSRCRVCDSKPPPVAATVAHHLAADATPATVARAGYRTMWPGPRTRARALYLYGAQLVAGFDVATRAQFYGTFSGLPRPRWSAYLAGDPPPETSPQRCGPSSRARLGPCVPVSRPVRISLKVNG